MSATDELRKLLTERGVEWTARPDGVTEWVHDGMTCKTVDRTTVGIEHLTMLVPVLTPDQAIAATLGHSLNNPSMSETLSERGTCHDKGGTDENGQQVFNCSECGCVLSLYDRDGSNNLCTGFVFDYPRYCPSCGRKVEG